MLEKFHSKLTGTISSDDIVPKLIQVGLLSHEEKNRISLATRNADRMKLVLDIVQKKPGKAFDKFLDAIKYRYTSLYDQMLKAKQAPISRRKPGIYPKSDIVSSRSLVPFMSGIQIFVTMVYYAHSTLVNIS